MFDDTVFLMSQRVRMPLEINYATLPLQLDVVAQYSVVSILHVHRSNILNTLNVISVIVTLAPYCYVAASSMCIPFMTLRIQ